MPEYSVRTRHPIAVDSGDTIRPHGAGFGGTSREPFLDEMTRVLGDGLRVLCLGCSGGKFVADLVERGHDACGLEGSDHHAKAGTASWGEYGGTRLFTCDISRRFQVVRDGRAAKFDLVTMWDVLEHIETDRLGRLFNNIERHLRLGGLLVGTIGLLKSEIDGVVYHKTVKPAEWWHERLDERFDSVDTGIFSTEAWHSMVCWHGPNRDVDHSTWIVKRRRAG